MRIKISIIRNKDNDIVINFSMGFLPGTLGEKLAKYLENKFRQAKEVSKEYNILFLLKNNA